MTKTVQTPPTQEEIASFRMQVHRNENYTTYTISLSPTNEAQKERLSHRFGIALRVLEDEQNLVLKVSADV